jgi:putative acetyltransferase
VLVRAEQADDRSAVAELQRTAFASHGDVVVRLVDDLRLSLGSEPGLSLVAVDETGVVIGHALFTRSWLDAPSRLVDVQVLSPLGVLPSAQGRGVGGELVRTGLHRLGEAGVPAVFLEGAPEYYSRFGFVAACDAGFRRPSLRIPVPAFQVCRLPAYEDWMTGTLVYRHEFWDHDLVGLRRPAAGSGDEQAGA